MKSSFRLTFFLFLAYLSITAKAFLPRTNLASGKSKTRDHVLITRYGLLKTSILFFKDNPQYLRNETLTGFLYDVLRDLSENPKAAKTTIDTISAKIKYINAISDIQSANVEMDSSPLNSTADVHFDGEQFLQGSKRLIKLRQELITLLLKGDKLQHARNLAGNALHTLQDFYSRSNWIELGNTLPFNALAQPGSDISQEIIIAGATEPTCRDCLSDYESNQSTDTCENNLITAKLTSGYRSGQDIKKPVNVGKCSHGGQTDDSRLKPATGGINKDSFSKRESPHASLHKVAADMAIEASSIFLNDVRSAVGDDIFARFLNLKSDKSMALVIDVSGSMRDEINDVKKMSIDFVRKTLEKKGASFTYILVPFSDPDVGPVTVTNDAEVVIEAVNNLTASGGGDCPELGMTGLYQALLHCLPESNILYFSDADVKDESRKNEVESLAKEKKVEINFILSGKCSRRRRRDLSQSRTQHSSVPHRSRRTVQGQALYQDLATQSGGQVLETSKAAIADIVKAIDPVGFSNSTADLKEVGLLSIEESQAQYFSGDIYFVDIDSTLDRLVFTLTAASSPGLQITSVHGNSNMQEKQITNSSKLLIKEITNLVSGPLKLTVSCNGPYTLQVTGASPIDFTYQLLDVEDIERGTTRRVVGNPLRGQMLLLTLDFVGQDIDAINNLTLVGVDGTDLETFNITQGEGFYQDSYYVTFIPSPDRFRLKVTGFDTSGARFQRVKPTLFTLGDVKLSQNVDSLNNSNAIFPGETLELEINVENSGDTQTLHFKASDDLNYVNSINPGQSTLGKNDTLTLRVSLLAPSDATYGVTSTVTVFASQTSDFTQVVNFMVLFVTVASKHPDLSPPSCTVTNQTGLCAGVYGKPECVSTTWFARVMFKDTGEGILSITSRENRNGTLTVSAFNRGAVNTNITASFQSNCCHPKVIFVGLDLVGNMGTCSVSLVPDIVSFGAKPNTTAVSLRNGETTKVPFTLTNLGSRGSFSFRVTKTSSLISYVIPFSLALDANASAAGHVVIASRGDSSQLEKLIVTAVAQSDTVNIKEVTLFEIQVSVLSETPPTTPGTQALKQIRLEAVAPNNHQSIKPGARLELNFTVTNLAAAETFTFDVLANQSSITGMVEPSIVSLQTTQKALCLLILTSQQDASPGTVTQVNVTATPASYNANIKQLDIFSLTVTTDRKLPVKNDDLEDEDLGKEKRLERWQLSLIISAVTFLIFLITILVICLVSRASKRRAMRRRNKNHGNQHRFDNFDNVIVNNYA